MSDWLKQFLHLPKRQPVADPIAACERRRLAWREIALTTAFNRRGTTQLQYMDSFIDEAAARAAECASKDEGISVMVEAFIAYERECPLELATPVEWAAA